MQIEIETPIQDDVRELIVELNNYMIPLTPREFQFQMTAEQMDQSDTTLLVARNDDGKAIGMGALKIHDNGLGEVKRMYTREEMRGKRVAAKILAQLEMLAKNKGIDELKLETGEASGFELAWRLYERSGYEVCGVFSDYPDSGYSRFYSKKIA